MQNRTRIFLLIIFLISLVGFFNFYKINSVECVSQHKICDSRLNDDIRSINNFGILATRKKLVKIMENNPIVKKYSLQLQLNGKYLVKIEERESKYCLKSGEKIYYADLDGKILKIDTAGDDNCIKKNTANYTEGNTMDQNDIFSVRVYDIVKNIDGVGMASVDNNNLIVEYEGNIKLLFPLVDKTKLLAGKAYYIISQFDKIEKYIIENGYSTVSEVDFRFTNPIVRYI